MISTLLLSHSISILCVAGIIASPIKPVVDELFKYKKYVSEIQQPGNGIRLLYNRVLAWLGYGH
jgi:hypothetical protein